MTSSGAGTPTLIARVEGSAALRRRQAIGRALANALGRVQVDGLDRIPATGPVILAVNHRSLMDGPLLFGFIGRPVACLVKSEAFVPVVGSLLRGAGQIRVEREQIDPHPV